MDVLAALPVSLRQLQYIVAVADRGGFRRAAEACHVSQPSLSAQVALAESALGLKIFERVGPRVRIASAGAPMVEQARRVLIAAADLRELARQLSDPFCGTIRLGVIPTVCPYLLPDISPALAAAFPRLAIAWSEERTGALVRQVNDGSLDGAILAFESQIGDLEHARLARDPFVLAAAPGHPLVKPARSARADALEGADLLLLEDGHCFRDQALAICARAGAKPSAYRATSLATLVQMASTSSGATLLPALALPVENRRGQLRVRPFASPGPGRTLILAWRKGSALAEPMAKIARVIKEKMDR